ncbi:MAG: exodeoxyribonuclease V subunit gamma [Propionibacteriaceae bacterium]|nr:exodeoxyribonuclease V subunit gamma [Propionibacteriaceae bacterium]
MNQMLLHTAVDLGSLAEAFVAASASTGDPFARPLVLVPGAGLQRWLSQQVARGSSTDGEGISAGFDVHRWAELEALLDPRRMEDAWLPDRLVWSVLDVVEAGAPGLEPLARHLAANDQRYANALRVARLLQRYADHRPALLAHWSAEPDAAAKALGFDGWQVWLWTALRARLAAPDPVERRRALAATVASGSVPVGWPSVHVFAPRRATPVQRGLLRALAARVDVHVWLPTAGTAQSSNALATALGRSGREWHTAWVEAADEVIDHGGAARPDTTLGRLQAAIHAGDEVPTALDDATMQVHASHGPARQVEVLREALTQAFADDPTLEPRDVVVACPDPDALAPHLAAAFSDHGEAGRGWQHPGTHLRLQVVEADAAGANQLYTLLSDLLTLGATRASSTQLLALASHPFVARRFGFSGDDLDRLADLIGQAAIRWGINPEHRARFGLGDIQQNTWQLGVQRLLLGEAFSDDHLASVGVVSTVDDVASTDTELVGALAELVSRTSRLVRSFAEPGTAQEWAARLRTAVDLLAEVPFAEGWQLGQVWAVLAAIEARGATSSTRLQPADALALLTDAFAERGVRPAFGTGALVVCSLEALARVPHQVVCLVGLDERSFPRRGLGDGDDLLARDPEPGDPDPGSEDRQAVLDAVLAAQQRLIVVYQGHSSLTPEPHHPPAGVQELIEAVGEDAVRHESLHAFAPTNFTGPRPSFDVAALRGAATSLAPRAPAPDRWEVGHLPRTTPLVELDVERLAALLKHPGRYLLKERAGLTLGEGEPLAESIPLELNGLHQWKIGDAMLAALRAGHPPDAVTTSQWLGGELPPRQLGVPTIRAVAEKAQSVHQGFMKVADAPPEVHVVDLDIDGVRLTGRLVTRGGRVAESHYGAIRADHRAMAWVRLLALTVATGRRTDAILVGGRGPSQLTAPPVELAQSFLADLVELARHGTEQVLPLPPRVAEYWVEQRHRGLDPLARRDKVDRLWSWDADDVWRLWFPRGEHPWSWRRHPGDPWGAPTEDSLLGALAMRFWEPIRKACP